MVSTLIWVPVGVKIGMSPRLSRYAQPVVQVLASFPAILLFPFAIVAFLALGVSLNFGGILLMALGAQRYILFNVIAGASAIPTDLREPAGTRVSEDEARAQLDIAIQWGRYAELFDYGADNRELILSEPAPGA